MVEWYVAEGESVALDQPVVALESAKAVVDIPSPVAGRVRRHCAQPGETVATGAPLVEFEVDAGVARASTGAMPDAAAADTAAAPGAPRKPISPPVSRCIGRRIRCAPGAGEARRTCFIRGSGSHRRDAGGAGEGAGAGRRSRNRDRHRPAGANPRSPTSSARQGNRRDEASATSSARRRQIRARRRRRDARRSSPGTTPGRRRCAASARRWRNAWRDPMRGSSP